MPALSLLKSRRFLPFFVTQFWGAFNDNLLKNAFVLWVTFHEARVFGLPSGQAVALAGGVFILPFFFFSAQAGEWGDRLDKAPFIRWIKLSEVGMAGIAGVAFYFNSPDLLLICLFLMGTHSAFFGPIKYSLLPQHLADSQLPVGNGLVGAATFLAILTGTITGGLLVAADFGKIWVPIVSMTVALIGFGVSWAIPPAPPPRVGETLVWNPFAPLRQTLGVVKEYPVLLSSLLGISWFWLLGAVSLAIIPLFVKDVLAQGEKTVTLYLSLFCVGIALGALFSSYACKRMTRQWLLLLGGAGLTITLGLLAYSPIALAGDWVLALLFTLFALCGGLFVVPLYTEMQRLSPDGERSRVIACNNIGNALAMVVGSLGLMQALRFDQSLHNIFLGLGLLNTLATFAAHRFSRSVKKGFDY